MRNAFVRTLIEMARENDKIFLITGDLGYSVLESFRDEFPQRFLNIGIAEQDMAGVAAGLAKEGYTVFIYSIGNFPTLRCIEQIRYDICYHGLNVKIISVGAGYAYGPLGVSHHTTEDIGMLRTIPGLVVTSPCDPLEVAALTEYMVKNNGAAYMRLNKAGERNLHMKLLATSGKPLKILTGKSKLVLGTGAIIQDAFVHAEKNKWELWSFPIVSPMDKSWINESILDFDEIITIEEHQMNSGFGSAILEALSDSFEEGRLSRFPKVKRKAVPNIFIGESGSQEYLRGRAGLSF